MTTTADMRRLIEQLAYQLAEADGFERSQEYYWAQAQEQAIPPRVHEYQVSALGEQ